MAPKTESGEDEEHVMTDPLPAVEVQDECEHLETITGSAKGIRREVCKKCGHVSESPVGRHLAKGEQAPA